MRKRRTSAPARKTKYVRTSFFFFFSAFLGVSRQGEFENTRKKLSTFPKKITGEITSFPFDFVVALVKRLSVRGTQKRDKKNHVIVRVQKFNPGQIKYVRTLAVFFHFFFGRPLGSWFASHTNCFRARSSGAKLSWRTRLSATYGRAAHGEIIGPYSGDEHHPPSEVPSSPLQDRGAREFRHGPQ
jgi:hypothetical protein